jgi:hypothetical protein
MRRPFWRQHWTGRAAAELECPSQRRAKAVLFLSFESGVCYTDDQKEVFIWLSSQVLYIIISTRVVQRLQAISSINTNNKQSFPHMPPRVHRSYPTIGEPAISKQRHCDGHKTTRFCSGEGGARNESQELRLEKKARNPPSRCQAGWRIKHVFFNAPAPRVNASAPDWRRAWY